MNEINQSDMQVEKTRSNPRGRARAAADVPPVMPVPEEVVSQLRALQEQMGKGPNLTPKQRQAYRDLVRLTQPTVNSSISIIGTSENVSQAVGHPADEVLRKVDLSNRWTAVEDEMRAMLERVSDANLFRRYEIALIAAQAYSIGKQLARRPENAILQTHLQDIKRLKGFGRRKRRQQSPEASAEQLSPSSDATATESSVELQK